MPTARQLVTGADDKALETIVKRWYTKVIEVSWDTWNAELGVETAFDLTDPAVRRVLADAGGRIKGINDTTRSELADVLQYGEAHGWSIDDLVAGDPANNIPGIKDVIAETYAGRADTVARTEMAWAQQTASVGRYAAAGVANVLVLDNGASDDDEPCVTANGQIWTLDEADANPIEHPNCTRGFGAVFD
jgi:hypothetical protein